MGHDDAVSTKKAIDSAGLAAARRVTPGSVDLTARTTDTPGFTGGRAVGKQVLGLADPLGDLQERFFAEGLSDAGKWSVLLVLREMTPQWAVADFEVEEHRERLLADQV